MEEIIREEKSSKKAQFLIILVALLVLIVIGQAIALFRIHAEKKEAKAAVRNTAPAVQNYNPHTTQQSSPQAFLTIQQIPSQSKQRPAQTQAAYDPFDFWNDSMFEEMELMQRKMNRLMDHFAHSSFAPQASLSGNQADFGFSPSADLEDAGDHWIARFDMPGLDKDKIEVQVQNGLLTVQGERKSERKTEDESKGFYASEIQYGSFARSVPLPSDADESNVEANYDKGVLTVKIGKTAQSKSTAKKVAVS